MSTEYVHVGRHADILASCRHIGPGERVTDDDLTDEDRYLIEEGRLVDVSTFTAEHSNAEQLVRDEPESKPFLPSSVASTITKPQAPASADQEGA